jgi:hypothetical protein
MPSSKDQVPGKFIYDEAALRRAIPYTLIATDMPGVYTSPALPDDFDPNTASPAELVKNGLLVRRPGKTDPPELVAAWKRAFSRKWSAADRIVPQFGTPIVKPPVLRKPMKKVADKRYTSPNWAGAVFDSGKWAGIIASWKVPTVSPQPGETSPNGWFSASWIGIDGWDPATSNDVLQAGVAQVIPPPQYKPQYYAWYEWYAPPAPGDPPYVNPVLITNVPVSPGDEVFCQVAYVGNTAGYIMFANETTGKYFTLTLAPPPQASFDGASIEWIMEAQIDLPVFTPLEFDLAVGCKPGFQTNVTAADVANPEDADIVNILGPAGILTKVATGDYTVAIDYLG